MRMNSSYSNIDYTLLFIVLLLGFISCFTLYTLQPFLPDSLEGQNFVVKQLIWYLIGLGLIAAMMRFDYDRLRQIVWFLYGAGLIPLLVLFFNFPPQIVHTANNATSWLIFPGLGTIQPAEFTKVILAVTIAHLLISHNEKHKKRTNKTDIWLLCKIAFVSLPPMTLIAVQPDLGGFLVLCAIVGAMVIVSGIRWRVLLFLFILVILVIGMAAVFSLLFPETIGTALEDSIFRHVESRFHGWLNPEEYSDSGYQLLRAMTAIGSGQLFGKGIYDLEVYIPERHTDMIFTAIAEQFGFIGASFVIALFFALIYRLIHIALACKDQFGSFIVSGLVGMFAFQIFQNIGMSIQLLPITGLPLPFLSYGGSSTLTYLIAIGLALNIHSRTKQYMFN